GLLTKMKDAVASMFSSGPAHKSPKHVEAGKKAAATVKVDNAATAASKAVKKVAKKVGAPAKKRATRKRK
ncbi:MAG: hypothetical protein ABI460_19740, partial [Caldimonas sp.]